MPQFSILQRGIVSNVAESQASPRMAVTDPLPQHQQPTTRSAVGVNKNEIKITAEGIAKLTFSFLDEHHADSSLEPGEVKTPPHSPSPVAFVNDTAAPVPPALSSAAAKTRPTMQCAGKQLSGDKPAAKAASQSDAQACQEKVRAILELDAIKRRQEADMKKQRGLQEDNDDDDDDDCVIEKVEFLEKKRLKKERKRLKKLKKEKKAAKKRKNADGDDGGRYITANKKKQRVKDYNSEESQGGEDLRGIIGVAGARYGLMPSVHPLLPPYPENFIGFHVLNPFVRMPPRPPEFQGQRGIGFHMARGRGGMRGGMRFPGFRPPFVHGPPRHIIPRPQNPLPSRGHSPVLPPNDNLIWTTTKPSISYAFNLRDVCTSADLVDPAMFIKTDRCKKTPPVRSEHRKKSKKSHERDKIRKSRSSRNSCEQSSRRKIEKIRKSLEKLEHRQLSSSQDSTPTNTNMPDSENRLRRKLKLKKISDDSEEMWDNYDEPKHTNIAIQPVKPVLLPLKAMEDDSISSKLFETDNVNTNEAQQQSTEEPQRAITPEGPVLPPKTVTNESFEKKGETNNFDMFAEALSTDRTSSSPNSINVYNIDTELLQEEDISKDTSKKPVQHTTNTVKHIQSEPESLITSSKNSVSTAQASSTLSSKKKQKPQTVQITKSSKQTSASHNTKTHIHTHHDQIFDEEPNTPPKILLQEDPSTTPPKSLLKEVSFKLLKQTPDAEKTALQKAIETQSRIGKLLKEDDDLDASVISKIKAKSLEHKRLKEKEASSKKKQHEEVILTKKPMEARRSRTPDPVRNIKNPFRRSRSRNRYVRRTRSRTPQRQSNSKRSATAKSYHSSFGRSDAYNYSISSTTLHRSRSGEKERGSHRRTTRDKSPLLNEKSMNLNKRKDEKKSSKVSSVAAAKQKIKQKTPLSFTAAEFLFPDEDDESSSQTVLEERSQKMDLVKAGMKRSSSVVEDKNDSPDTDDYMDNWENDDADLDLNSNNACDSSTPLRSSSQEEIEEQMFVTRFVNPSPPLAASHQPLKATTEPKNEGDNATAEVLDMPLTPPINLIGLKQEPTKDTLTPDLFGMQEIYDQFIKSVEESGVDLKSNDSAAVKKIANSSANKSPDNLSIASSASSSSTTSSSSSASSSSDTSNSSSSSSSTASSSSASSSEESNDANESFANVTLDSPRPKPKFREAKGLSLCMESREKSLTPPLPLPNTGMPAIKIEKHTSCYPTPVSIIPPPSTPPPLLSPTTLHAVTSIEDQTSYQTTSAASVEPIITMEMSKEMTPASTESVGTPNSAKTQKSDVAKDFKKLKNLEANLSRIQMMRANYDSADEISEELLKMENLFMQEKNLILQKYAKSSASNKDTNHSATEALTPPQHEELQQEGEAAPSQAAVAEANKIFDANRETIKLTISPIKLPKTPAIFEKPGAVDEHEFDEGTVRDAEEPDFTEKLQKPAKEVAIVKPMMETKEARQTSQQRSTRRAISPLSRRAHDERARARSPSSSGYRRSERRRSSSRSRQQRIRSLSPPHRSGSSGGSSTAFSTSQSRYRSAGRRSRSRSITRQSNRRRGEASPTRSRRGVGANYYRKSTQAQQRSSQHGSRSPPTARSAALKPHSPPPSVTNRRSYSRDRYSSRSPLPFKPPSPPMRRSLSPRMQRHSSLLASPTRSSSSRRSSHSPRSPRSHSRSRSPCYDERRRRRAGSYERRSPSLQRQYFAQEPAAAGAQTPTASSYYYNLSPSRISLDARINIVLNGAPNQDGTSVAPSYDSYSSYSQYGGQYMSLPPHPDAATGYSINYAGHQYVPIPASSASHSAASSSTHKPLYSNIPTIGGTGEGMPPATSPLLPHYYYNEFGDLVSDHQLSTSVLKELPKAMVAVQKGNVLEIVPSTANDGQSSGSEQMSLKNAKVKKAVKVSWKEEINKRHVAAAVMRLSRESSGNAKGILKKLSSSASGATSNESEESSNKSTKKKVYFEDGIFPSRDSDDEDRQIIDTKIRRKLRRLQKLHGITINAGANLAQDSNQKTSNTPFDQLPPPPPPPGAPPAHLEQPIYLRPPTPTPLLYFHFDSMVHSMYVSQLERPIPPRLLNPKQQQSSAGSGGGNNVTMQSPANTQSPNGGASMIQNMSNSKKELNAMLVMSRPSRGIERCSSKTTSSATGVAQRRDNHLSVLKTMSIETIHTENSAAPIHLNSFQLPLPANVGNSAVTTTTAPPPHSSALPCVPSVVGQRQCAPPIGFLGMRFNNFMRLPPSPLARSGLAHAHAAHGMPVMGMRTHTFNMPPPPPIMPPNGHQQQQHLSPTADFGLPHLQFQQQQQYHHVQANLQHSPHMQHPHHQHHQHHHQTSSPYHAPHNVHFTHTPPSHHLHQQRQQQQQQQSQPQFYLQSIPPPPIPPPGHGESVESGAQAIIPPYNIKRQ